jgi:hypothetical protein
MCKVTVLFRCSECGKESKKSITVSEEALNALSLNLYEVIDSSNPHEILYCKRNHQCQQCHEAWVSLVRLSAI